MTTTIYSRSVRDTGTAGWNLQEINSQRFQRCLAEHLSQAISLGALNAPLRSPALMTLMIVLGCEISRGSGFKPKVQKEIIPSKIFEAHAQTIQQMASLALLEGHKREATRQASQACFDCINYRTLEHIFSANSTTFRHKIPEIGLTLIHY